MHLSQSLSEDTRGLFKTFAWISAAAIGMVACGGAARGPEEYRDDTRAVIEANNGNIKACYDRLLASGSEAGGIVVVNFTVEKKTGAFKQVSYDVNETTAPETVAMCVVQTLEVLTLDPADKRDGVATFRWEFGQDSSTQS